MIARISNSKSLPLTISGACKMGCD